MIERSSDASAQDAQGIRFSDELSVAEVARLMAHLRRVPAISSDYGATQSDEAGTTREWMR